ncbi:MAG: hypothetical protein ACFFD2_19735 [Promethearchaeota archaeon]
MGALNITLDGLDPATDAPRNNLTVGLLVCEEIEHWHRNLELIKAVYKFLHLIRRLIDKFSFEKK